MKNQLKPLGILLFIFIFIFSCKEEELITDSDLFSIEENVLQNRIENPYSLENMKKAWEIIQQTQPELTKGVKMDFYVTHYYIKFKPKNEEELSQLINQSKIAKKSSNLVLSEVPLDYDLDKLEIFYQQKDLSKSLSLDQYTIVKVDEKLPKNFDYEILAELMQPEFDDNDPLIQQYGYPIIEALEDKALELVGIDITKEKEVGKSISKRRCRRCITPQGNIYLRNVPRGPADWENTYLEDIDNPLSKIIVRIKIRWRVDEMRITNAHGFFKGDKKTRHQLRYLLFTSDQKHFSPHFIIYANYSSHLFKGGLYGTYRQGLFHRFTH